MEIIAHKTRYSVYVSRDKHANSCSGYWSLYADYPTAEAAENSAVDAIKAGYNHAEVRINKRFSKPEYF